MWCRVGALAALATHLVAGMTLQSSRTLGPSVRSDVASFKVMDVVRRAGLLEAAGKKVYHLEVGQPDAGVPAAVRQAVARALDQGTTGYTTAMGIPELREAIVGHYEQTQGIAPGSVDPERIAITTGSSGGFLLAFCACFDKGDHIAVGSTCYPCYRNILQAMDCHTVIVPLNDEFKLTAKELRQEVERRRAEGLPPLKGIIQSSPANPTGSMLNEDEVRAMCKYCAEEGIWFISDEIYLSLTYGDTPAKSAIAFAEYADNVLILNSFSKYFAMTGWRLGWMVVPDSLVDPIYRLQANMFINAPTLSQYAAVECFTDESIAEYETHVQRYAKNRMVVLKALKELKIKTSPCHGAFYAYCDLGSLAGETKDGFGAEALCDALLDEMNVAISPGTDFEDPASGLGFKRIRFSFPGPCEDIEEGMRRFKSWWPTWLARVGAP